LLLINIKQVNRLFCVSCIKLITRKITLSSYRYSISALIISLLVLVPSPVFSDNSSTVTNNHSEETLVVGVFPRRNKKVTEKIFSPFSEYLEAKLQRRIKLEVPQTFLEFWEGVQQKKYDLVHYNQYHYIVSHKDVGYTVILRNKEFGDATISGAVIVREDSGINSIADLKGKNIIFGGGPRAMQSYIYARYLLEQENLLEGQYKKNFSRNPPNAIYAVYYGQADAAGIGDKVMQLDMVKNNIDIGKIKILAKGEQLPQLPWAVRDSMSSELKKAITQLLSTLHESQEGKEILNTAKLDQLIVTKDEDYNEHRKIVKSVLDESY